MPLEHIKTLYLEIIPLRFKQNINSNNLINTLNITITIKTCIALRVSIYGYTKSES